MAVVLLACMILRNCILHILKQIKRDGASVHTNHCTFIIIEHVPKLDFVQVRFLTNLKIGAT